MATIAENIQTIIDIKADIKTAIENKGVEVGNVGFDEYAGKIDSIESGIVTIDVNRIELKFGYSGFSTIPDYFDFSNISYPHYMFYMCSQLSEIPSSFNNINNATNLNYTFCGCSRLESVPLINTSTIRTMQGTFENCTNITTLPQYNTSNVWNFSNMLMNCMNLTSLPELDFTSAYSFVFPFAGCTKLTDVGGFKNLGYGYFNPPEFTDSELTDGPGKYSDFSLSACPLTRQSCVNIINGLYNISGYEDTTNLHITLNRNSYESLYESDIAIATNKGWTVESA